MGRERGMKEKRETEKGYEKQEMPRTKWRREEERKKGKEGR